MNRKLQVLIAVLLAWSFMPVKSVTAQTWSQLVTSGSPPTGNNVSNYDATNNRLIVFFPRNSTLASDQVWVLANANGLGGTPTWTQLEPTGTTPMINALATVVYNSKANELIVYGGCSATCSPDLGDVYVLSHANGLGGTPAWSTSSPSTSIPRDGQSAVYDSKTDSMITFGGGGGFWGDDQNDTNVLSPASGTSPTWTTLAPSGGPPGIRQEHTAVYDQTHNRMIIFGGIELISTCCPINASDYNDVWVLSDANGKSGTPEWTQLEPEGTPPPGRSEHSAVYVSAQNTMYVFGGVSWSNSTQTWTYLGDVWKLTNADGLSPTPPRWTQVGQYGTPPGANCAGGIGYDSVNKRIIVFGGTDRYGNFHNLTFILDLTEN
jgi:hypothetical protein